MPPVAAPSTSTAVAPRMVPVDRCGQEMVSEASLASRKDAMDPRSKPSTPDQGDKHTLAVPHQDESLFWDKMRSSVQLTSSTWTCLSWLQSSSSVDETCPVSTTQRSSRRCSATWNSTYRIWSCEAAVCTTPRRPRATICQRWSRMTSTGHHTLYLPVVTTGNGAQ